MRRLHVIMGAYVLAQMLGCAHVPHVNLNSIAVQPYEIQSVPFFAQRKQQCGAAALATVMAHRGIPVTAKTLEPYVYLPGKEGSLNIELMAQSRRYGLLAISINDINALLNQVSNGTPVLIMQNLGLSWLPQWHFAVVIGFDPNNNQLILRSGNEPRKNIHINTFLATWKRANNWGMVVTKPDHVPIEIQSHDFIRAAIAMEQIGKHHEARQAYLAAYNTWPEEETYLAQLGIANLAYLSGDIDQAKLWLLKAINYHPRKIAAWNNLAFIELELGCPEQAKQAITCAINLAPQENSLLASQKEIFDSIRSTTTNKNPSDHCSRITC